MSSPRQKEAERVCASVRLNSQEERAHVAAKATQRDHAAEVSVACRFLSKPFLARRLRLS